MDILIVDNHPVVRCGYKKILSDVERRFDFGDANSYREAIAKLEEKNWNAVIMDINLPDKNGLELIKRIKRDWRDLPVLVVSGFPEEQYALRTLRAGAAGYMTKTSDANEIVTAVSKVTRGLRYINEVVADRLAQALDAGSAGPRYQALSDREYQVLCMIASGKSVSQIAAELAVSVKTVSTYRARILSKMRMKHNAELTHYALKKGLVN